MATRKVFMDQHDNEMDCYLNDEGLVFIQIGISNSEIHEKRYIVLDKLDVGEFIKVLSDIQKDM